MAGLIFGYARVSTSEQRTDMQADALMRAGVVRKRLYADIVSGTKWGNERPQFAAMLHQMRAGDVLVIWKLDRLGRSTARILDTLADLDKRGIAFRVLTQPALDTSSPMGRLIVTVMAAFAELERDLMRERTRAGLAAVVERGGRLGRPPKASAAAVLEAAERLAPGQAAAALGMTPAGLRKRLAGLRAGAI